MGFHSQLRVLMLLLFLLLSTQACTSRTEDRGYNPDPYSREEVQPRNDIPEEYQDEVDSREKLTDPPREEGPRVEKGRGFNIAPVEDNVSGTDCMLMENMNSFGDIDGSVDPQEIDFKYQLETIPNGQADTRTILEDLERAILDKVLSILFADVCRVSRRRQVRSMVRARRLKVIGATTFPEDLVIEGVTCIAEDASNDCQQVSGQMYVYTEDGVLEKAVETNVLNKIKDSMDAGEFDDAHPDIANVKFIDAVGTEIQAGPQGTVSDNPQRLRFPFYAIAAVGGLMIIAVGIMWRRRNRADDDSALTGDTSTLQPGASESQVAAQSSEPKPIGDSTDLETTMDFSSIQID